MAKNTYAELMNATDIMTTGLQAHLDEVSQRGLDRAFIEELVELKVRAVTLNGEQETLKADLKMKTAELDTVTGQIAAKLAESRKVVKLAIQPQGWKAFGIDASR